MKRVSWIFFRAKDEKLAQARAQEAGRGLLQSLRRVLGFGLSSKVCKLGLRVQGLGFAVCLRGISSVFLLLWQCLFGWICPQEKLRAEMMQKFAEDS